MALFEEAIYVEKLVEFSWVILREGCLLAYDLIYRRQSNMKRWLSKGVDNSKRVVNLRDRSNKIALALASIHFYSGICTGTGNIFIGELSLGSCWILPQFVSFPSSLVPMIRIHMWLLGLLQFPQDPIWLPFSFLWIPCFLFLWEFPVLTHVSYLSVLWFGLLSQLCYLSCHTDNNGLSLLLVSVHSRWFRTFFPVQFWPLCILRLQILCG